MAKSKKGFVLYFEKKVDSVWKKDYQNLGINNIAESEKAEEKARNIIKEKTTAGEIIKNALIRWGKVYSIFIN